MVLQFNNYKKEKCDLCGNEDHICTDVFETKVCPDCFKEFGKYRNIVDNMVKRERPIRQKIIIKKESVATLSMLK